ncbi:MAG: ABC transporter permease [Lachnospiraceae bacterium]|nr:ABC transporter permease [Lachnospiraceae bacterium]
MTSKHFLVKYMIEDLRHRLWMLALSVLGSFLCMPVAYLLVMGTYRSRYEAYLASYGTEKAADALLTGLYNYFQGIGLGLNGAVAICGAVIVGLFGFRYVFRQDMVDTFHSAPIKRSTLFWIHYLNGFLIWLIPFCVCGVLTLIMAASDMAKSGVPGQMLGCALTSCLVIMVSFLTIYSLVLLGVMLAGNILNALVVMGFVGFAASAVYLVVYIGLESYMENFWQMPVAYQDSVLWLSPAISAVWILIYRLSDTLLLSSGLILRCLIVLLTAVVMLIAALLVYLKRPSEAAGQGVYRKGVAAVMRMVTAIVAGFGGWWFFSAISSEGYVAWGIFGAILVSFLVYGVLDIVFTMDFKAFWRHKIPMAVSVVCTIFIGLSFYYDWYGYDSYLPAKDQIADMGIFLYSSSYRNGYRDEVLSAMHYTDTDNIYAVLANGSGAAYHEQATTDTVETTTYTATESCIVRVTLKNGRSYYRRYVLDSGCQDALTQIAESEDYISVMYAVPQIAAETCDSISIYREDMEYYTEDTEELQALITALKEDIDTYGRQAVCSDEKVYCRLRYGYYGEDGYTRSNFAFITEDYVNTVAVLNDLGLEEFIQEMDPEAVSYIEFSCDIYASDFENTDNILTVIGDRFGVDLSGETLSLDSEKYAELAESLYGENQYGYAKLTIQITDPDEIEELLLLCDYYSYPSYPTRTELFSSASDASVYVVMKEGEGSSYTESSGYSFTIPYGKMPKEYILRLAAQLEKEE